MTVDDLIALFEKHRDAFLKEPLPGCCIGTQRRDLAAFVILDRLIPGNADIVACAEHDQIWLSIDLGRLAAVATEKDIIDLIRCGCFCDEDALSMYV